MASGLGNFLTNLVGKSNVEAAQNAYDNSRFKGTVDDVSAGLGSLRDQAGSAYDALQADRVARFGAREAAQLQAARDSGVTGLPSTDEQALGDMSADFMGLGAARAWNAMNKTPINPAAKTVQFTKNPTITIDEKMAVDAANKAAGKKADEFWGSLSDTGMMPGTRKQMNTYEIAQANKAARYPRSSWANPTSRADAITQGVNAKKFKDGVEYLYDRDLQKITEKAKEELARRMAPNHPGGLS